MAPLTGGGLATMRVVTARPPGGEPALVMAALRMPVGDTAADNFATGGIAAPIDMATGRVGRAVRNNGPVYDEYDVHPTTGARIAGTVVSRWTEVVALVLRAHRALPTLPVVGWDVAVGEDGPILVEGNKFPSARLSQVASGIGLGDTPFVQWFNAHLERSLGVADAAAVERPRVAADVAAGSRSPADDPVAD